MKKGKKIVKDGGHFTQPSTKNEIKRSRSNTPMNNTTHHSNQTSLSSVSYKDCNLRKWECESHFFQLKALEGYKVFYPHVSHNFAHQGAFNPCPTILKQFKNVELIPLFGLEREGPALKKSVKSCIQGLSYEVSKITNEENRRYERSQTMIAQAKPKHKTCQVCKQEFEDYGIHINTKRHKIQVAEALGTEYIEATINECQMSMLDMQEEQQLAKMTELCLRLEQTIPVLRKHSKSFFHQLNRLR